MSDEADFTDRRDAGLGEPDPDDPMGPPAEPCECWCMNCRRTFMSSEIWFQRIVGAPPNELQGFWMCPTPNCGGAGFTFDIFPTDPNHPANDGWYDEDEEEEFFDDEEGPFNESDESGTTADWDPDESKYKELDEFFGDEPDDGDDLEGEEWKYGLQPGERPPATDWEEQARLEHEERERKFDAPDERPREVPWIDRGDRNKPEAGNKEWGEDDIPF